METPKTMELRTVRRVYRELTEEQKTLVHFLIGSLIERNEDVVKFFVEEGVLLKG